MEQGRQLSRATTPEVGARWWLYQNRAFQQGWRAELNYLEYAQRDPRLKPNHLATSPTLETHELRTTKLQLQQLLMQFRCIGRIYLSSI